MIIKISKEEIEKILFEHFEKQPMLSDMRVEKQRSGWSDNLVPRGFEITISDMIPLKLNTTPVKKVKKPFFFKQE